MFDVGLPEILVIIVVTLVVVGPKDLPRVVRGFARTVAKLRRMVDEFMGSVNEYVRESELEELRDAVNKTRRAMKGQGDFDHLLDPTGTTVKHKDPSAPKITPADPVPTDTAPTSADAVPATPDEKGEDPEAEADRDMAPPPSDRPDGKGAP
jgi:sec-independent protein translocase protein TatB